MRRAGAEGLKVFHAEGASEDRPQTIVEAFRGSVAGTVDEIVRDFGQPVLQRLTESIESLET